MGVRLALPLHSDEIEPVSDAGALQQLRDLKLKVRQLTKERMARFGPSSVPGMSAAWWQAFERHARMPSIDDPWQEFHAQVGDLDAAPMPTP